MNHESDEFSEIRFHHNNSVTSRLGFNLYQQSPVCQNFLPYLTINWWHTYDSTNKIHFNDTLIKTQKGFDSAEFGLGFASFIASRYEIYGEIDYEVNLGSEKQRSWGGSLGINYKW